MTLPASLSALGNHVQFINWASVPQADGSKPRKVPCDQAGLAIDPHNPAFWMTADAAYAMSMVTGHRVGFVMTAADPFWCIDLDHCLGADGDWTPASKQIVGAFPGAAVEVSVSGTGLHIWGVGTIPEGFKTRNTPLGIEVYSDLRFMALGDQCSGDAWLDWTGVLSTWVPQHLEAHTGGELSVGWTTEARPDYTGPDDDDVLIAKMLASGGVSAVMGDKATVRQLWEADSAALAQHFPDSGTRAYDASGADAALATHLAFWTGANCERIERLMRRSGLMRPKWDEHKSYLAQRTIGGVVARCTKVYDHPVTGTAVVRPDGTVGGSGLMTVTEQTEYFRQFCYVTSKDMIFDKVKDAWLTQSQFNNNYSKSEFIYTMDNRTTKKAWEAFTQNKVPGVDFTRADDIDFRPDKPDTNIVQIGPKTYLNTYVDPKVEYTHGDVTPFLDFMSKFIKDDRDREILLSYMAACVQHQGTKFKWCPVIIGIEGNGKGLLMAAMQYAICGPAGPNNNYVHQVSAGKLSEGGLKFNSWIEGKIVISLNEIHTRDKNGLVEALKELITEEWMEIEGKGTNQRMGHNNANLFCFSNWIDAIAITFKSRRYAVMYTGQQTEDDLARDFPDAGYFPALWDWFNLEGGAQALGGYLRGYNIAPEFDPSKLSHRAPVTSGTVQAVTASLGVVESFLVECFAEDRRGFRGGMCSSHTIIKELRDGGLQGRVGPNRVKSVMESIGYVRHPNLLDGRSTISITAEENSKPIIYIHKSLVGQFDGYEPRWVVIQYMNAQGYADQSQPQ